ncbi:MAG TPA: SIMPL domain-containing protein [Actinomycetes bacterium]|nr:SIMPL domain-containing protein [Actinomycetes bacterium]
MPEPERITTGPATVTVAGTGAASAVPDTALLQLGVETRGSTPAEALEACRRALDQVLAALDAEGVEPARRTTSGLELHEDWESRQPGKGPVAYQAGARLTVRLDRPERAGQVAAAAVAVAGAGARVHGLGFVVGDPGAVAVAAREAAWRDALARAEQYAALAGAALGPVLEIKEAPPPPPDARPMRLMAEAAPAGPATEPGETTIWAAVTVTWALHPR